MCYVFTLNVSIIKVERHWNVFICYLFIVIRCSIINHQPQFSTGDKFTQTSCEKSAGINTEQKDRRHWTALFPLSSGTECSVQKKKSSLKASMKRNMDCSKTVCRLLFIHIVFFPPLKLKHSIHKPTVSTSQCTSTSWPRIHLSLTHDTFLMALLGLPRWRTVSKRATRDPGKDTASKSKPAHSDPLTGQTQYCSCTLPCSVMKPRPVLTISPP